MREYERYVGLRGQVRVGLVDEVGRVHHFDVASAPKYDRAEPPREVRGIPPRSRRDTQ